MTFKEIPNEIMMQVFSQCPDVGTFLALAHTCHQLREVAFRQEDRLLEKVLDRQYGPVHPLLQLAHYDNEGSPSDASRAIQAHQLPALLAIGRVAEEWCQIYPFKKWNDDDNVVDRRCLDGAEARCLRQAVYRVWLYGATFHYGDSLGQNLDEDTGEEQADYLRRLGTRSLADMLDFYHMLIHVLGSSICPSNETVEHRVRKRVGDSHHLNFYVPVASGSRPLLAINNPHQDEGVEIAPPAGHSFDRYKPTREHNPAQEGWGSGNAHSALVRRMTKLNPAQILYLRKHARTKMEILAAVDYWGVALRSRTSKLLDFRQDFANGVPRTRAPRWGGLSGEEWLLWNQESLKSTLELLFTERGCNFRETIEAVREGRMGILGPSEDDEDEGPEE
ncbi:MAG: hypothetical protein Q9165_005425 [Trypethelium subeluteriae]